MKTYIAISEIHGPPKIFIDSSAFNQMTFKELKSFIDETVKSLRGKSFLNLDRQISISVIGDTSRKLSYGSRLNSKKAALAARIPDIIKFMIYSNWGKRKEKDKSTIVGYFNFKCIVSIDKIIYHLRISVQIRTDGKFYYNHEINSY